MAITARRSAAVSGVLDGAAAARAAI